MDKYVTIGEAAKLIGVSPETLRRWDKSGKFKSIRHPINNYRVYPENDILSLVNDFQIEIDYKSKNIIIDNQMPFFETSYGKLYQEDAINYLKSLESNSIDLIFADPPYNIKKAQWDTFSSQKEYVDWSMEWIREAH